MSLIDLKRAYGAAVLISAMAFAGQAFAGGPPNVAIASSSNPSSTGQSVNLTTTIGVGNGGNACTGTVTYSRTGGTSADGLICTGGQTQTLMTQGNNTGQAVCTATFNTAGTNFIKTVFTSTNGGANGCTNGNTSNLTQTVNAAVAAAVPTLGDWFKYGLIALLMISGLVFMARRNREHF